MIKPEFTNLDDALEYAAQLVEESSLLDLRGVMSKRKRDREDAQLRYQTIQETRADCAKHIRAFKNRPEKDAKSVLRDLAELPDDSRHDLHLRDAWPLAWKGWVNIEARIQCASNCIPPETEYRINITDRGREILDTDHRASEAQGE